jgi:hypothetical protein
VQVALPLCQSPDAETCGVGGVGTFLFGAYPTLRRLFTRSASVHSGDSRPSQLLLRSGPNASIPIAQRSGKHQAHWRAPRTHRQAAGIPLWHKDRNSRVLRCGIGRPTRENSRPSPESPVLGPPLLGCAMSQWQNCSGCIYENSLRKEPANAPDVLSSIRSGEAPSSPTHPARSDTSGVAGFRLRPIYVCSPDTRLTSPKMLSPSPAPERCSAPCRPGCRAIA